jgi:vacuolar-type H+-ATPase subunit E/Vma4
MNTAPPDSSEALREEVLAVARRERDEILQRARHEAEAILARARADADKLRSERLARARDEAGRRREMLLATVPTEAAQLRAARIETLLQSVCDEVRRRLRNREGFAYPETVIALAAEAIGQMAGDAFVVKLSPADGAAFGHELVAAVTQRVGCPAQAITLAEAAEITDGGVIVEDAAGRQVFDNRLPARLDRLWPELRRQIAGQTFLGTLGGQTGGAA